MPSSGTLGVRQALFHAFPALTGAQMNSRRPAPGLRSRARTRLKSTGSRHALCRLPLEGLARLPARRPREWCSAR